MLLNHFKIWFCGWFRLKMPPSFLIHSFYLFSFAEPKQSHSSSNSEKKRLNNCLFSTFNCFFRINLINWRLIVLLNVNVICFSGISSKISNEKMFFFFSRMRKIQITYYTTLLSMIIYLFFDFYKIIFWSDYGLCKIFVYNQFLYKK